MKEHSWSLFTFPVMDIKAAQELLDRRAEEGWTLDRVYLGSFARFVPAESREIWAVDWVRYDKGERQDYLALCLQGPSTIPQRKVMLAAKQEALRASIRELEESVAYIDWKQGFYDEVLSGKRPYVSNLIPTGSLKTD